MLLVKGVSGEICIPDTERESVYVLQRKRYHLHSCFRSAVGFLSLSECGSCLCLTKDTSIDNVGHTPWLQGVPCVYGLCMCLWCSCWQFQVAGVEARCVMPFLVYPSDQ